MSQPNRLIHSSGLLSFIRCNTDHERAPVSPVIPPLLFLHLYYKTSSHSSSKGNPEHFTQNSLSGQKCKHLVLFLNKHCLFNSDVNVIYSQFISNNEILGLNSTVQTPKNRELQRDRHLSNMGENISRIWHTSLSVSLSRSSINTVIHWQGFDVASSFSLHLGCMPSQEKLKPKKKAVN